MDWPGWASDVLTQGGWPTTPANVRFLTEWHGYEESACASNPLNTTLKRTGSTNCVQTSTPGVWVQAYPSHASGATATADTLHGFQYPNIQAALAQGDPYSYPLSQAVADEISRWGTPNYAAFYLTQVGGGTSGASAGPSPQVQALQDSAVAASAHGGWADLRNSVNRHLPTQLARSQALRLATMRDLGRRSKVRR